MQSSRDNYLNPLILMRVHSLRALAQFTVFAATVHHRSWKVHQSEVAPSSNQTERFADVARVGLGTSSLLKPSVSANEIMLSEAFHGQ